MGSDQKVAPKTKEQTPNKRPDSPSESAHHKGIQELEGTVLCYRGGARGSPTTSQQMLKYRLDPG